MDDEAFDQALIGAAFTLAAERGWQRVSIPEAARAAGLPLARARARFPGRPALLLRFGRLADQAALAELATVGSVRDRLFDLLMRRIDVLQAHRGGVIALLRALPFEPPTAALLACASRRSMRWLLQAVGVDTSGLRGELTLRGLIAVWLWTLRAWERDESADLSATMAALDAALRRAEQAASWLRGARPSAGSEPAAEPASAAPAEAAPATSAGEPPPEEPEPGPVPA